MSVDNFLPPLPSQYFNPDWVPEREHYPAGLRYTLFGLTPEDPPPAPEEWSSLIATALRTHHPDTSPEPATTTRPARIDPDFIRDSAQLLRHPLTRYTYRRYSALEWPAVIVHHLPLYLAPHEPALHALLSDHLATREISLSPQPPLRPLAHLHGPLLTRYHQLTPELHTFAPYFALLDRLATAPTQLLDPTTRRATPMPPHYVATQIALYTTAAARFIPLYLEHCCLTAALRALTPLAALQVNL